MSAYKITYFTILFILSNSFLFAQQKIDSVLICNVKFQDSQYDNLHAGSGFLLEEDGTYFLCTAKHVLFFAKTKAMDAVSFGNELVSWTFESPAQQGKKLLADQLVNENKAEKLGEGIKGDWLVFSYKGEPKGVHAFKRRKNPIRKGEKLLFMGYKYGEISLPPTRISGTFVEYTSEGNLLVDVPPARYNGCSGGPVFDENGQLVGLVSMGFFDEKQGTIRFEPAGLWYLNEVLKP